MAEILRPVPIRPGSGERQSDLKLAPPTLLGTQRLLYEGPDGDNSSLFAEDPFIGRQSRDSAYINKFTQDTLNFFPQGKVKDLSEIHTYMENLDDEGRRRLRSRIVTRFAERHGRKETDAHVKEAEVRKAFRQASKLFSVHLEDPDQGVMAPFVTSHGLANELDFGDDPVDVLSHMFNPEASRRLRYEARRTMHYAGLFMEANKKIAEKSGEMRKAIAMLNEHIWMGSETDTVGYDVITTHNPEDYACTNVHVMEDGEVRDGLESNERFMQFAMRRWMTADGDEKHAYFEAREKDPNELVLKMERMRTVDPSQVNDLLRMRFTFPEEGDIADFLCTMWERGIDIEVVQDTMGGGVYEGATEGASKDLRAVKCIMKIDDTKYSVTMGTIQTWVDGYYRDKIAHTEFAVSRFLDDDVSDRAYPPDIYGADIGLWRTQLVHARRAHNRKTDGVLPLERRRVEGESGERYIFVD